MRCLKSWEHVNELGLILKHHCIKIQRCTYLLFENQAGESKLNEMPVMSLWYSSPKKRMAHSVVIAMCVICISTVLLSNYFKHERMWTGLYLLSWNWSTMHPLSERQPAKRMAVRLDKSSVHSSLLHFSCSLCKQKTRCIPAFIKTGSCAVGFPPSSRKEGKEFQKIV